jgi:hypothetical protein
MKFGTNAARCAALATERGTLGTYVTRKEAERAERQALDT